MRPVTRTSVFLLILLTVTFVSPSLVFAQQGMPFNGLMLTYYSETTQTLLDRTGIHGAWWTALLFQNVSSLSSDMIISVNATITANGQQQVEKLNTTVGFPTNRDTLIYLRNGGQENLAIFAGPSGVTIPSFPGLTVDLTRSWSLHDKPLIRTPLGAFSAYRYHTAIKSVPVANGQTVDLDFYASYAMNTQVLIAGEVWATLNGSSAMVAETEIRAANAVFTSPVSSSSCLIATATFGSELAPQVQFLRGFRDQKLDNTFAGYNFMIAFNLWYYSFSPAGASIISATSPLQNLMRILLFPLIMLLEVSAVIFDAFSFQPEVAAVLSGLVASGLLGIVYLWIPSAIICRRYKHIVRRSFRPLAVILAGAMIALAASEVFTISLLAVTGSVTLVLANMLLLGALPAIFPSLSSVRQRFAQ